MKIKILLSLVVILFGIQLKSQVSFKLVSSDFYKMKNIQNLGDYSKKTLVIQQFTITEK